jgi:hypothetical protein
MGMMYKYFKFAKLLQFLIVDTKNIKNQALITFVIMACISVFTPWEMKNQATIKSVVLLVFWWPRKFQAFGQFDQVTTFHWWWKF